LFREVEQRFLDNLIPAYEMYSSDQGIEVKPRELLAVQILKARWNESYRLFISGSEFRSILADYIRLSKKSDVDKKGYFDW
jgi:hypothetical protein